MPRLTFKMPPAPFNLVKKHKITFQSLTNVVELEIPGDANRMINIDQLQCIK